MKKEYRLVVAGGRDFKNYLLLSKELKKYINELGSEYSIIILSGGASGADTLGEKFAKNHKLKVERYPAEWKMYGRAAGPKRNAQMIQAADGLIVFWDKSRGIQRI